MMIYRKELPRVWFSSSIWNVTAVRSSEYPGNYKFNLALHEKGRGVLPCGFYGFHRRWFVLWVLGNLPRHLAEQPVPCQQQQTAFAAFSGYAKFAGDRLCSIKFFYVSGFRADLSPTRTRQDYRIPTKIVFRAGSPLPSRRCHRPWMQTRCTTWLPCLERQPPLANHFRSSSFLPLHSRAALKSSNPFFRRFISPMTYKCSIE